MDNNKRILTSLEIDEGYNPKEFEQGDLPDDVWEMLSSDISHETIAYLIEIEINPGEWYLITSNPTEFNGFDEETKDPKYCSTFGGKKYEFVPFSIITESQTPDGEITKTQISVANTGFEMVKSIYDAGTSMAFKCKLVRLDDETILEKNDYLRLLNVVFTDTQIFGTLGSYHKLAEQLPIERYLPSII